MARTQRIEYEGAVYHVTARGNERREIFGDDKPRQEDVASRRMPRRVEVEVILESVCRRLAVDRGSLLRTRRDSGPRAVAARMLCDHGDLTQRQVAQTLGLRSGAVREQATLRSLTQSTMTADFRDLREGGRGQLTYLDLELSMVSPERTGPLQRLSGTETLTTVQDSRKEKEKRRFRGKANRPLPPHVKSGPDPSVRLARKISGRPCVPGKLLEEPGTSGGPSAKTGCERGSIWRAGLIRNRLPSAGGRFCKDFRPRRASLRSYS